MVSASDDRSGNNLSYEFTNSDFELISDIAMEQFGISLPDSKKSMVYSRVSRRLRALDCADFSTYRELILGSNGAAEQVELLSALTTNVTHFFREQHHFDFLTETVAPRMAERASAGKRVRVWSAGCSTGQEPYSIALSLLESHPRLSNLDFKILATDIDPKVIAFAERGRFKRRDLSTISETLVDKYFLQSETDSDSFEVCSDLKKMITFGVLNITKPFPFRGPFDVIFCRNVAIYFNKETQESVWEKISTVLPKGGHLFIGHSERLCGTAVSSLRSVGVTSYEKYS